jgi:hypothetical protein
MTCGALISILVSGVSPFTIQRLLANCSPFKGDLGAFGYCGRGSACTENGSCLRDIQREDHCVCFDFMKSSFDLDIHAGYTTGSFGGTDGQYYYNDTWSFDLQTRKWSELNCSGFIPSPREGHAAAIIGDVVYIFGGRGVDGKDLGDLCALKISSERWLHLTLFTSTDFGV